MQICLPGNYCIEGSLEKAARNGQGLFAYQSKITVGSTITVFLPLVYATAGILLFLYLLVAGIQLITSGGNPKVVEAAKSRITNAVIGAVVITLAYLVIKLIQLTLTTG